MTTFIAYHEVENGERWAKAWRPGPGSRHELFARFGVAARTFRDPDRTHYTGLILVAADVERFDALMNSEEGKQAMAEDGLKVDTMRMLQEFTP